MQQASFLYHEMPMQRIMREGRLRILCVWEGGGRKLLAGWKLEPTEEGSSPPLPPRLRKILNSAKLMISRHLQNAIYLLLVTQFCA